jgi:hypothetical protein
MELAIAMGSRGPGADSITCAPTAGESADCPSSWFRQERGGMSAVRGETRISSGTPLESG